MSERLKFEVVCPNNHNQTVQFSEEEYNDMRKNGDLVFHCNTCDIDWPPSGEDQARFRKEFTKDSE